MKAYKINNESLLFEVIGTCACGQSATIEARTGISHKVWSNPKKYCQDCWQNELTKLDEQGWS